MSALEEERFHYAVNVVLNHEGGLCNDAHDKGGQTAWGISETWVRDEGLDVIISALTKDEAAAIYREYWWDRYGYNAINDLILATKLLDMSVNEGPFRAHRQLQTAINDLQPEHIAVDGILGPKTLELTNSLSAGKILIELRAIQKAFYLNLIKETPNLEAFKDGWLHRAAW